MPAVLPDDLPPASIAVIESTYFLVASLPGPDGMARFALLSPGRPTIPLDLLSEGTAVSAAWGRVVASRREGGSIVAFEVSLSTGELREIYRTADPRGGIGHVSPALHAEGRRLYLVGAGVREVDLQTGTERVVIDGPGDEFRTEPEWSPSGRTLVSAVCDMDTCVLDVLDVTDDSHLRVEDFSPLATSDRWVLGTRGRHDPRWTACDLTDGSLRTLADGVILSAYSGYATDESHAVISGRGPEGGLAVMVVDLATGDERLVWEEPVGPEEYYLHDFTGSDRWALLSDRAELLDEVASGFAFDLMDLEAGTLDPNAVPVFPSR